MSGPEPEKVEKVRRTRRKHAQVVAPSGTTLAEPGAEIRTTGWRGLSGKMLSTVLAAVGTQVVALAVNWVSTGSFDRVEAAQVVGIALTAVFGTVAGYVAQPDKQTTRRA